MCTIDTARNHEEQCKDKAGRGPFIQAGQPGACPNAFSTTSTPAQNEQCEYENSITQSITGDIPDRSACSSGSSGDPHLRLAHGGRTDFRGEHDSIFTVLSAKDVAINIKTENSTFKLGNSTIHGSFITEAHVAMLTRKPDGAATRYFNVSFWANHLDHTGMAYDMVTGYCNKIGNPPLPFQLHPHDKKDCDNLIASTDYSSAKIETDEFSITIRGQPVYDRIQGPRHRIDLELTPKVADHEFAIPPHGIIGQSYDGDSTPRHGRLDAYPPRDEDSTFTTTAMGEGAIEGVAADYKVSSPYETRFKYSAFDYPMAVEGVAAIEAKRKHMLRNQTGLHSSGAVEVDAKHAATAKKFELR